MLINVHGPFLNKMNINTHTYTHTLIHHVNHSSLSLSLRNHTQAAIHHRLPFRLTDGLELENVFKVKLRKAKTKFLQKTL